MCRSLIIKKNGGCPLLRRSVLSVLIFSWLFGFFLNPLIVINRSNCSSEYPWSSTKNYRGRFKFSTYYRTIGKQFSRFPDDLFV